MAYKNGATYSEGGIEYTIYEHISVLEKHGSGWNLECNVVSWNGGEPKIDIRSWDPSHCRMTRGLALTEEQAETLARSLADRYRQRSARSRTAPETDGPER